MGTKSGTASGPGPIPRPHNTPSRVVFPFNPRKKDHIDHTSPDNPALSNPSSQSGLDFKEPSPFVFISCSFVVPASLT